MITLNLSTSTLLNLELAIEGAIEELETLERDSEWFVTKTADQLRDCLAYIQEAKTNAED